MPRRRRNRNQKRRQGDVTTRNERNETVETSESATRTSEGLKEDPLTLELLNETLQGVVVVVNQPDDQPRINQVEKINEINCKISENPILNNQTPRRPLRNLKSESYINNLSTNSSQTYLKSKNHYKFRSNSSTSKLRSPGLEKIPITVDVSTQTVRFESLKPKNETLYLESCINIFETPKVTKSEVNRKRLDVNKLDLNLEPLNLNKMRFKKLKNFSEILFSPNNSEGEVSFQNLIDKNDVSTPILINNINNPIISTPKNQNFSNLLNNSNNLNNPIKINNSNSKLNPIKEKIKLKKFEPSLITKKRYKTVSPRKYPVKNAASSLDLKKMKNDFVPKSFSPPRNNTTHKTTENILNITANHGKLFTNIKRFHTRFVSRWIAKISEICGWLGLSLKKTLSTVSKYKPEIPKPIEVTTGTNPKVTTPIYQKCVNCEEHQMKLIVLSSKVDVLEHELAKKTAENDETIARLNQEITKIKEEVLQIDGLKTKLKEIEEIVQRNKQIGGCGHPTPIGFPTNCNLDGNLGPSLNPSLGVPPCPPPGPPPLPPPLPPPPMFNLNLDIPTVKKIGGAKRPERKPNENSRPVISLDDILKVKLKKTTEKPLSARRPHQPLISVEMLNQIKLRPTSRPETPSSFKEVSSGSHSIPNSPGTSLSKILGNVDTNVRRIKRLKRTNRFSLDDFSRRRVLKREWSGSDDT